MAPHDRLRDLGGVPGCLELVDTEREVPQAGPRQVARKGTILRADGRSRICVATSIPRMVYGFLVVIDRLTATRTYHFRNDALTSGDLSTAKAQIPSGIPKK